MLGGLGLPGGRGAAPGRSEGFTRLGPSIVFLLALAASMAGLVLALREIPVGTGYAVWIGIGSALAVGYGMATGAEPASPLRILLLATPIAAVIGLKLTH